MSTAQERPADPHYQVEVTLDSCAKEDAGAVLATLNSSFASDRASDDLPADSADGHPVVWTATYDVSRPLGPPRPAAARLGAPVMVTAQGPYRSVARLREGLAQVFAVRVVGTASGDQEQEVWLRVETR